jgi:hypothetical protein
MRYTISENGIEFAVEVISVYVPAGVKKTFRHVCNERGQSMSRAISRLIIQEIKTKLPYMDYDYKTGRFVYNKNYKKKKRVQS